MMKIYIISLVSTLILAVGFFYWFGFRPVEIRKECFVEASKNAIEDTNPPLYQGSQDRIVRMQLQYQLIESGYLSCVRQNGLAN
jgi:hypothetical protein